MRRHIPAVLRGVAALGALLAVGVPAPGPRGEAQATSLAPLSVGQLTDASTYIVRGTVTRVWTEADGQGDVWTRASISVSQTLKGPDRPTTLTVDSLGGTAGGVTEVVYEAARFSEGEDVILFLDTIRDGKLTPVGMYEGKYIVRRAPGDDEPYVRTVHMDPHLKYDGRFLPHPAAADRLYLSDFLDEVETRLQAGWDGNPIPGISKDRLQQINAPERRLVK